MTSISTKDNYKSVFISDVHLGTKACKAKSLHAFLDTFEAENLFLVGDIIDGWALRRRHYWTKKQTEVIRRVLKLSHFAAGTTGLKNKQKLFDEFSNYQRR